MIMSLKATIQSLRRTYVFCYRMELQVCPDCCRERANQSLLTWCSSHDLHSKLTERSYDVVSKLTENNLCLFSNNIVATSVVVNSAALNSKAPRRVIFHLLTIEINYAAMKSWFAMNLDNVMSHY
ncbi:hypothetical protein N665_1912s0005 [Sinapis alba]|nr:hypothetical protein N665_1912s0005 [Sinapis alba]